MTERAGYSLAGNPLTLFGEELKVGQIAPDFTLLNPELEKVSLSDMKGKKLLVVVPSLDTGVCEMETVRFNREVEQLEGVSTAIISADLPFAQARFAAEKNIEGLVFLSDHFDMSFGDAYGTHIKELRLNNRSIFVLDEDNKLLYVDYIKENTEHPKYDEVLAALK